MIGYECLAGPPRVRRRERRADRAQADPRRARAAARGRPATGVRAAGRPGAAQGPRASASRRRRLPRRGRRRRAPAGRWPRCRPARGDRRWRRGRRPRSSSPGPRAPAAPHGRLGRQRSRRASCSPVLVLRRCAASPAPSPPRATGAGERVRRPSRRHRARSRAGRPGAYVGRPVDDVQRELPALGLHVQRRDRTGSATPSCPTGHRRRPGAARRCSRGDTVVVTYAVADVHARAPGRRQRRHRSPRSSPAPCPGRVAGTAPDGPRRRATSARPATTAPAGTGRRRAARPARRSRRRPRAPSRADDDPPPASRRRTTPAAGGSTSPARDVSAASRRSAASARGLRPADGRGRRSQTAPPRQASAAVSTNPRSVAAIGQHDEQPEDGEPGQARARRRARRGRDRRRRAGRRPRRPASPSDGGDRGERRPQRDGRPQDSPPKSTGQPELEQDQRQHGQRRDRAAAAGRGGARGVGGTSSRRPRVAGLERVRPGAARLAGGRRRRGPRPAEGGGGGAAAPRPDPGRSRRGRSAGGPSGGAGRRRRRRLHRVRRRRAGVRAAAAGAAAPAGAPPGSPACWTGPGRAGSSRRSWVGRADSRVLLGAVARGPAGRPAALRTVSAPVPGAAWADPLRHLGSAGWLRAPASSSPEPRCSPGGWPTATGRGWPSSCARSGSTSAHVVVVGDRPDDLRAALDLPRRHRRRAGDHLRRTRTDRRRPDRRGGRASSRAGPRRSTRRWRQRIGAVVERLMARRGWRADPGGHCRRRAQAGPGARRRDGAGAGGHRARARRPARRRPRRADGGGAARAARGAAGHVAGRAGAPRPSSGARRPRRSCGRRRVRLWGTLESAAGRHPARARARSWPGWRSPPACGTASWRSSPASPPAAQPAYDRLVARCSPASYADTLFSTGPTVDELVADALADRGLTVATAESCTGGLLAARLTDAARLVGLGARRGRRLRELGQGAAARRAGRAAGEHGAVSAGGGRGAWPTARARRFGADVGVGITGIAGPGRRHAGEAGGHRAPLRGRPEGRRRGRSCCPARGRPSRDARSRRCSAAVLLREVTSDEPVTAHGPLPRRGWTSLRAGRITADQPGEMPRRQPEVGSAARPPERARGRVRVGHWSGKARAGRTPGAGQWVRCRP